MRKCHSLKLNTKENSAFQGKILQSLVSLNKVEKAITVEVKTLYPSLYTESVGAEVNKKEESRGVKTPILRGGCSDHHGMNVFSATPLNLTGKY